MADEELKIGDTVRPNSGGPLMTITGTSVDEKGQPVIWTVWFDKTGKESTGYYPAAIVQKDDGMPSIA